jgi:hypothetical protein
MKGYIIMIYKIDYFGFVYIWKDMLRKKYYIGSHYGSMNDNYISSSKWFNAAFKKRPQDFKRRILQVINIKSVKDVQLAEQNWLNLIKNEELATSISVMAGSYKYYNMKKTATGGNGKANIGKNKNPWNKGISNEMQDLRRRGLFCLLRDKPKIKVIHIKPAKNLVKIGKRHYKITYQLICQACNGVMIRSSAAIKTCSRACQGKLKRKNPIKFKNGGKRVAWNKGLPNPTAATNGKKGAAKQSEKVKGRKLVTNLDGSRTWQYPEKNINSCSNLDD